MRRWKGLPAVALVATAVVVGACGGDGDGQDDEFTVVGTEMAFDGPDRVRSGTYEVTFENDGMVPHELAFRHPSGRFVARRSIGAGMRAEMKVILEPGTWELGCYEPGHYEAGMHRRLVVEAPEGS